MPRPFYLYIKQVVNVVLNLTPPLLMCATHELQFLKMVSEILIIKDKIQLSRIYYTYV